MPTLRGAVRRLRLKALLLRENVRYRREFAAFSTDSAAKNRDLPLWKDRWPCFLENTSETAFDAHYIYHPAWAARILAQTRPEKHVDISSTLHFCSLISAFIPVDFYDFRPAPLHLSGLVAGRADVTQLRFATDSVASLSCMHTVEHIGLGRYGDPLDADGDTKAMQELARVLAPGGRLFFVVPVGRPRVQFNAQRVYNFEQVTAAFPGLQLLEWALLPDDPSGGLIERAKPEEFAAQVYGCGCFCFTKS